MRGIHAGASLFMIVAVIGSLFSTISPMWLIQRTELHNQLCWTGSGIFQVDFTWGSDIPEMLLVCKAGIGSKNSTQYARHAYCETNSALKDPQMCTAVKQAEALGVLSGFVMIATLLGIIFAWRSIEYLRIGNRVILGLISLCFVLESWKFVVMFQSPLFSKQHYRDISSSNPVPFKDFGCIFQSPLVHLNLKELIHGNPLQCLYAGPSFAMSAISFTSSFCAMIMFIVQIYTENMPYVSSYSYTPQQSSLNIRLFSPRHYSLFGAIFRKYSSISTSTRRNATTTAIGNGSKVVNIDWVKRAFFVSVVPILVMLNAGLFAWMMCTNGAAVQVFIRANLDANDLPSHKDPFRLRNALFPHATVFGLDQNGNIIQKVGPIDETTIFNNLSSIKSFQFEIIEEVFDFTMIMSIKNFWDGNAYLLAILTCVFCAIWPFLKVVVWIFLWFVPAEEFSRGRTLTWFDALGKWSLVNFYVLSFMGVAFHLDSEFVLSLYPEIIRHGRGLKFGVEVVLSPRFATYLFIAGSIWSLILGEVMVKVHRVCKEWEEVRRDSQARFLRSRNNITGHASTSISSTGNPYFQELDTPFLDVVHDTDTNNSSMDSQEFQQQQQLLLQGEFEQQGRVREISTSSNDDSSRASFLRSNSISWYDQTDMIRYRDGYGYEALCDRYHSPIPNKKFRYTAFGQCLVWLVFAFTTCTILTGLLVVSISFNFGGLVGSSLVMEKDRHREFSLLSTGDSIRHEIGARPEMIQFLTIVYFIFSFVCPILYVVCLIGMWSFPMRLESQKRWFHVMEILGAWSALDVYLVSLIAAALEIADLSKSILGGSFPGLESLVEKLIPNRDGLFGVTVDLESGIYVLLVGVIAEKSLAQFIVPQFATAIAERQARHEGILKRLRLRQQGFAVEGNTAAVIGETLPPIAESLAEEIAEHPETLIVMSPAARYETASGLTSIVYSGFPRIMWSFGISLGIMREVTQEELLLDNGSNDDGFVYCQSIR